MQLLLKAFSNPDVAWAFYGHRLEMYRKTNPHAGFSMLLDLVKSKNNNYFVYTSNVDGHFQKRVLMLIGYVKYTAVFITYNAR